MSSILHTHTLKHHFPLKLFYTYSHLFRIGNENEAKWKEIVKTDNRKSTNDKNKIRNKKITESIKDKQAAKSKKKKQKKKKKNSEKITKSEFSHLSFRMQKEERKTNKAEEN